MPKLIHDEAVRLELERRVLALTPDLVPRWGRMSVDQMLWHLSEAMAAHLVEAPAKKTPLPAPMMRFVVLKLPWAKGLPTDPALVAKHQHDFEEQRARCLSLLRELASRPMDVPWPRHGTFGTMTGRQVSALQVKHLNHHLTQFGV
jgi:hypothetical protein